MGMKVFFLGVHRPSWLSKLPVPVCISYGTLMHRTTYPTRRKDPQGRPYPLMIDSRGSQASAGKTAGSRP